MQARRVAARNARGARYGDIVVGYNAAPAYSKPKPPAFCVTDLVFVEQGGRTWTTCGVFAFSGQTKEEQKETKE